MKKHIVDMVRTVGTEKSAQVKYGLYEKNYFVGSDERRYTGITAAQNAAHRHVEEFPDVYEFAAKVKFLHLDH